MSCWNCKRRTKNFRCQECLDKLGVNHTVFKEGRELSSDPEDRIIETHNGTNVYGRDIIQPYKEGHINQKFVDRYGDGMIKGGRSQLDGRGDEMDKVEVKE